MVLRSDSNENSKMEPHMFYWRGFTAQGEDRENERNHLSVENILVSVAGGILGVKITYGVVSWKH